MAESGDRTIVINLDFGIRAEHLVPSRIVDRASAVKTVDDGPDRCPDDPEPLPLDAEKFRQ